MPVYHYDNSSLIDEVTVIKNATGGQRAYLHARDGATAEELAQVTKLFEDAGFPAVACERNSKAVLEIRGFGKENVLLEKLSTSRLTHGQATKNDVPEDKISWKEKFKANSLWWVAGTYLAGDAGFMTYEHMNADDEKEKLSFLDRVMERTGGLGYLVGSAALLGSLLTGKDRAEDEIQKAAQKAMTKALEQGIELEDASQLVQFSNQKDTRSKFSQSFSKYPSEVMNAGFAAAGVGIAYNARRKYKNFQNSEPEPGEEFKFKSDKRTARLDRYLGLVTLASGTAGIILPEKEVDPTVPRKKGINGAIQWLTEKPLRIAGGGLLVSTAMHIVSTSMTWIGLKSDKTISDANRKKERAGVFARAFFILASGIAEIILTFSSKGHGQGVKTDESVDRTTCALVANMIHKQPQQTRADLIEKMSETLAKPDALGTPKEELKTIIAEQIAALEKNPWANTERKLEAPLMAQADAEIPARSLEQKPHPRINQTTETGVGAGLT